MNFKSLLLTPLAGVILLAGVTFSTAGYKMGDKKPVKADTTPQASSSAEKPIPVKKYSNGKADESPIINRLAQKYQVPPGQLEYFRKLKYGYEELVPSLVVAQAAQVEVGQILSMRDRGQTWRQISSTYSVDLRPLNKKVEEDLKPIQRSLPKQMLEERPTFVNNGK